jgi:hypothetical protein
VDYGRAMLRLAFALMIVAGEARADAPIEAMVGFGVASISDTGYGGTNHSFALDTALAYRLGPHFALGVRFAMATPTSYVGAPDYGNLPGDYEQATYSVIPIDVGLTAMFARGAFWIAPWVGEHISWSQGTDNVDGPMASITTADFPIVGLTAGVDLFADHRDKLGLYADIRHSVGGRGGADQTSDSNPDFESWAAITVGIAYHR